MDNNEIRLMKFCPNCGKEITHPNARFCIACGLRFEDLNPEKEAAQATAEAPVSDNITETLVETPAEAAAETIETSAEETAPQPEEQAAGEQPRTVYAAPVYMNDRHYTNGFEDSVKQYEQVRTRYAGMSVSRPTYAADVQPVAETKTAEQSKKKMPKWGIALIVIGGVLITMLVVLFVVMFAAFATRYYENRRGSEKEPSSVTERNDDDRREEVKLGEDDKEKDKDKDANENGGASEEASASRASYVYEKCAKSVVGISVLYKSSSTPWSDSSYTELGEGSGVILTKDGYIVTNCHVISSALETDKVKLKKDYQIRVYTDASLAKYYVAEVVGADYTSDLAVLKIDEKDLTPVEFGSSGEASIGDEVFIIGCPGGLEFMGSITKGIIGGLNKNLLTSDGYAYDLIQTDAAINPGNSGGAMLSKDGKLLGICEMKIAEDNYEGMGFAIASDTVKSICEELINNGKVVRPALGITVNTSYGTLTAGDSGLPAGAWIASVESDSVAGKAGLKADMIITEFNGVAVYDFVSLRAEIMKCSVGDNVTVKCYVFKSNDKENGKYETFTIKLQSLEDEHRDFD